jgi:hypothetical protein
LLVAAGESWRAPDETELAGLTRETPQSTVLADDTACARLFSVPMHMRGRFWAMLDEEAAEGAGDFVNFSADLAEFLTFKALPPPKDAVYELILQDAAGQVTADDAWALVNFGEEPVLLAWPQLQLRLNAGEGLQVAPASPPDVVPPANDEMNVLVAIRLGAA